MKRLLLLAAVLTALIVFSGCQGKQKAGGSGAENVKQTIEFKGYPMDAQNQTIRWYVGDGYILNAAYASPDESPFHKYLKEMLGVNIEWQLPPAGSDINQSFNLMMASEKLPDVIYFTVAADAERYIDEGTFRDLTPYLEKWSPAYWKWIHSNPAYDKAMKTDSGKYFGYGFFREAGGWNDTYLGPVVNKTWLDELGLPMPATVSDWDKTLRAFKQKYGAVLSFARSRVYDYGTLLSGAFGSYTFIRYRLYVDPSGKVQLANAQQNYLNQMVKMNEWWKDGLIDQDFLTITDTVARSNALNKKMGISYTSMGQLSNWINDARGAKNGVNWTALQFARGDDGTLTMVPGGNGIGASAAVITTDCPDEKLELVMRALDYAYTEEGNLYWNYGKQGLSWDYGADGKPAYLPLVTGDPNGLNDAISKYGGSTWSGNCIQATAMLYMKNAPEAIAANDLWFYPNEAIASNWRLPTSLTMTPDESSRAAELASAIQTYTEEMAVKFITGTAQFSTWDSYVQQLNSMGLPELLKIYQGSYDRYLAR